LLHNFPANELKQSSWFLHSKQYPGFSKSKHFYKPSQNVREVPHKQFDPFSEQAGRHCPGYIINETQNDFSSHETLSEPHKHLDSPI
jgi:hypothetical protein